MISEAVFESPKLSTRYKLAFIETYQAHKSDFDEVENNIDSYYGKLVTIKNLLAENTSNGSKLLDEDSMRTNQNVSMLINALDSRLDFLTKANLHMECYLGKVAKKKSFQSRFNISRIADRTINSRTNENNSLFNIFYCLSALICFLFENKNYKSIHLYLLSFKNCHRLIYSLYKKK